MYPLHACIGNGCGFVLRARRRLDHPPLALHHIPTPPATRIKLNAATSHNGKTRELRSSIGALPQQHDKFITSAISGLPWRTSPSFSFSSASPSPTLQPTSAIGILGTSTARILPHCRMFVSLPCMYRVWLWLRASRALPSWFPPREILLRCSHSSSSTRTSRAPYSPTSALSRLTRSGEES